MNEALTVSHALSFLAGAGFLLALLRTIAPQTQTTADDRMVAAADSGLAWLRTNAPGIWASVEAASAILSKTQPGSKLDSAAKLARYLLEVRDAYNKSHGVAGELPPTIAEPAKVLAAALSADDKLRRLDPPQAPGSR